MLDKDSRNPLDSHKVDQINLNYKVNRTVLLQKV